jgi:hypothetical protein
MKLTAAFLALFEDASAVVDPGPRTNDDTAYGDIVFTGCQIDRLQVCSNKNLKKKHLTLTLFLVKSSYSSWSSL